MDNHSGVKANASRRRFAKSIVSAAAALPLLPALINAQDRERAKDAGAQPATRTDVRTEHDTPPPVLLMNGSLIFEVATPITSPPAATDSGDARQYRIPLKKIGGGTPSGDIFLAHIKIVDGDGEMLFRFNNTRREAVAVTIVDDHGDVLTLSAEGRGLLSDLRRRKKIGPKRDDPPMNPGRMRLRYVDDPGGDERNMNFVKVSVPARNETLFNLDIMRRLRSRGVELKVMIWWEVV